MLLSFKSHYEHVCVCVCGSSTAAFRLVLALKKSAFVKEDLRRASSVLRAVEQVSGRGADKTHHGRDQYKNSW